MHVNTALGTFQVRYSARGLTGLTFVRQAGPSAPRHRLATQLRRYAEGQRVRWSVSLDLSRGTVFQRKVWRALQQIPYGQTRSYAWVARRIGKPTAARAVGAACRANPIPLIIPCHRVVASDGSLGGYSAGLAWKKKLLRLEGVAL